MFYLIYVYLYYDLLVILKSTFKFYFTIPFNEQMSYNIFSDENGENIYMY